MKSRMGRQPIVAGSSVKALLAQDAERYSLQPSRRTIYTVGHTGITDGITSESEPFAIAALKATAPAQAQGTVKSRFLVLVAREPRHQLARSKEFAAGVHLALEVDFSHPFTRSDSFNDHGCRGFKLGKRGFVALRGGG